MKRSRIGTGTGTTTVIMTTSTRDSHRGSDTATSTLIPHSLTRIRITPTCSIDTATECAGEAGDPNVPHGHDDHDPVTGITGATAPPFITYFHFQIS